MTLAAAIAAAHVAGTCRFRHTVTYEPPYAHGGGHAETGEIDFARGRVRHRLEDSPTLEALARMLAERWPWLDDDDDDDVEEPSITVGSAHYYGGVTIVEGDHAGRPRQADPRWILDQPTHTDAGWRVEITEWSADDAGGLARIDWVVHPRSRPRGPLKLEHRPRHRLELADFGAPVDIPVPVPDPPGRFRDLPVAVYRLWRRKRAWRSRRRT